MESLWKLDLRLRITAGGIIALAVVAIIVAYFYVPTAYTSHVVFSGTAIGVGAAIFSAYYAGTQLRLGLARDKLAKAYVFLSQYNELDTVRVLVIIKEDMKNDLSAKQLYKEISEDKEKHSKIMHLLGIFEDMSVAIQLGYADEQALFRAMWASSIEYYEGLRPYIKGIREERGIQEFYCEYEALVAAWKEKKSLVTGKLIDC